MKLRLITYNMHKGFSPANRRLTLSLMKQKLLALNPDVILLQEIVGENERHKETHAEWPKQGQIEFMAEGAFKHFSYGKNAVFSYRHHGNAIFSRWPILNFENTSISTNRFEQRGLLHAEVATPTAGSMHLFNVHLDLTSAGRRLQLAKIIGRAQASVPADAPFVIAGDFNDWRVQASRPFADILQMHEACHHASGKHASTFPSFKPFLALDRVYFRNLKVKSADALPSAEWRSLSDHLPLCVDFD